jgi:hypothetical protein
MTERIEGNTPSQESESQYQENSISESEFSELSQNAEEVGSSYGQYGNWRAFHHSKKEGWYVVEYTSKDRLHGGTKYFETDDPKWEGHKE